VFRLNLNLEMLPLARSGKYWGVRLIGFPWGWYRIERATNLFGPWQQLSTLQAGPDGIASSLDISPPVTNAFYRAIGL